MMPRFPLIPTVVVALAIAAMIALGVWQLERRGEKARVLATYAANLGKPEIAFPRLPVGDENLFRAAHAMCLEAIGWKSQGGRSASGANGFRHIAECRTGAEGPVLLVDVGVSRDPMFKPAWKGGEVTGIITQAPDHRPMLAGMFSNQPRQLMLVSAKAAPGLEPTDRPSLDSVPNNHLAYAVQWFLFAAVAAIIYVLALKWRTRAKAA